MSDRFNRAAPLMAALLTLAVGVATVTPDLIGVFFDDGVYVLVAKALARGDGLVYPQLPGSPAAIHYPPLFPFLLSFVWRIAPEFPANAIWFKLVNPVLLAGAAAGAVVVATRLFAVRPAVALAVVLAATLSVPVHVLTTVVFSEPLFLALLFPALLAADAAYRSDGDGWAVTAAALAGALVLTRTIGGVVVIATVIALVHARRWRGAAIYVAAVALLLAPWQLFVWKHAPSYAPELRGSYGPYLEWLVDGYRAGGWPLLADVASKNFTDTWRSTGAVVAPLQLVALRSAVAVVAIALMSWGALRALAEPPRRIAALALGGYLALVAVWPYQVERFVWGVWPLILLFAYHGARDIYRVARARRRALATIVAVLAALPVLGHTFYNARGFARGWQSSASRGMHERLGPLVQYVVSEPRLRGAVISTEASPLVALYSGGLVVPVEILEVRDHIADKTTAERAAIIGAIDRRFRPDAYVLMARGPYLPALLQTNFDPGRHFFELTPAGYPVRAFRIPR